MKKLTVILALIFCVVFSSCSYSSQFVIVNRSNAPVDVEYVIASKFDSLENTANKPYKMDLSNWDSRFGEKEWRDVAQNEYRFDAATKTCRITLLPNEVLRFYHERDRANGEYEFRVASLKLSGVNGEILFEGKEFYKQFEKTGQHSYSATYK